MQIRKRMEHKKFIAATKVSLVEFAIHLNFKLTNLVFDQLISLLGLVTVSSYWAEAAICKYLSKPVSSTVSVKYGDDGKGNIRFPTITICLDSFRRITQSKNGMYSKCSNEAWTFHGALASCTADQAYGSTPSLETSTSAYNPFAIFDYDYETKVDKFQDIKDFLNVSNLIKVETFLEAFSFGDDIKIKNDINHNEKKELLNKFWKPILHYQQGFCYSFEPNDHGLNELPAYGKNKDIINAELKVNVSEFHCF